MKIICYNHYITVDEQSRITGGWSDGPNRERDTAGAILLTDKGDYQFRLFPDGEENPSLFDMDGMIPLYKWDGSRVLPRSAEEIEADRAVIPAPEPTPTTDERLAQLEAELARANAKNAALVESQQFLEECLVEMAGVVYA